MELSALQQQLKEQLTKQYNGKVIHTDLWCIPVMSYQVQFKPIEKRAMDILMKILLFSFQKSTFESVEQLSDILLVEPLFIEDILLKMQKNGLLAQNNDSYHLTDKGRQQFSQGVFEEELELETIEILYSPVHQKRLEGDIEDVLDFDDYPDKMYAHLPEEQQEIKEEFVLQEISSILNDEEERKKEVKSIISIEHSQTNDVPCIEFIVMKEENKELIIRVWNTLYNNWDTHLERELTEKGLSNINEIQS